MFRTHTCGELRSVDAGKTLTLAGWVHRRRDHGGIVFVDLRDRWGLTQIVLDPQACPALAERAHALRHEEVIQASGTVRMRPAGARNADLATGEVEVAVATLELLSRATPPPFEIDAEAKISEEVRLAHRHIDLRRPNLQRNLHLRHKAALAIRTFLDAEQFLEIETPSLYKSTPEGAREFLVPSRVNPGLFYALPQSPQVFKQVLMVAGFDRYFQIVRCFRDEDLRADRQPEFTQLDLEMSFVHQEDILDLVERLMARLFSEALGVALPLPLPRLTYREAMDRFGSDKPDLRFGLELRDVTEAVRGSPFRVFSEAVAAGGGEGGGGAVKVLPIEGGAAYGRGRIDKLAEVAAQAGAKGLAWAKIEPAGWTGPIAKFFDGKTQGRVNAVAGAKAGDLLLFAAGAHETACSVLGSLRLALARENDLVDRTKFAPCWVTEFPMFFRDAEGKWIAGHHLFTAVHPDDAERMEREPGAVRSLQHDLVINGHEIGGGSVRIHDWEMQRKVFSILGMTEEEAHARFGFFLDVLRAGAPPHGGIALGFDRLVALLAGEENIREVIAFPKTHKGTCLLTGSPGPASPCQLDALHIRPA